MPWAGRKRVKSLKAWIPVALFLVLMLLSFLVTPPTGEIIVSLEWNGIALIFVMTLTVAGIKKEKMLESLERSASVFSHLWSSAAFFAVISFILSPFISSLFTAPALTAVASSVLRKKEREAHIPSFAAIIAVSATAGGMLLPAGSLQNALLHKSFDEPFITTMLPLAIAAVPLIALAIPALLGKHIAEQTYINEESETQAGNKGMRMLYACFAFIITLTSLSLFGWPDILIFTVIILLLFDRTVFLKADYRFLISALFLSIAGRCFSPLLSPLFQDGSFWKTIVLGEIIGAYPAAAMTINLEMDKAMLLRAVNIASFGTLSSLPALLIFLQLRKDERKAFAVRYTIAAGLMLLILIAVTMALAH